MTNRIDNLQRKAVALEVARRIQGEVRGNPRSYFLEDVPTIRAQRANRVARFQGALLWAGLTWGSVPLAVVGALGVVGLYLSYGGRVGVLDGHRMVSAVFMVCMVGLLVGIMNVFLHEKYEAALHRVAHHRSATYTAKDVEDLQVLASVYHTAIEIEETALAAGAKEEMGAVLAGMYRITREELPVRDGSRQGERVS